MKTLLFEYVSRFVRSVEKVEAFFSFLLLPLVSFYSEGFDTKRYRRFTASDRLIHGSRNLEVLKHLSERITFDASISIQSTVSPYFLCFILTSGGNAGYPQGTEE
ncbi:hypothetical protein NPIL_277541 [Nephila pilipes]|uniref:Uncharacterized protein n=1 Tax=Nephila pilipes TaxID=299642 RepID=A0A8X6TY36_NEPPI|nr:hypothetical protein NPIL_277541 [Nephila pilipes]